MESPVNSNSTGSQKEMAEMLLGTGETQLSTIESGQVLFCRLCALELRDGLGAEGESESTKEPKWVHFLKSCEGSSDTIKDIVLKCLPKSLLTSVPEPNSPVICLLCYRSLLDLINFFDKISKGQEKLKKLLSESSESNKIIQVPVPRKRGRPRKAAATPQQDVTENVLQKEEPRPTRSSRTSKRYADAEEPSLKLSVSSPAPALPETVDERKETTLIGDMADKEIGVEEVENNLATTHAEVDDTDLGNIGQYDSTFSIKSSRLPEGKNYMRKRKRGRPRKVKKLLFKCDKCGKSYFHYSSLIYHRLSAHENKEGLQCTVCQKSFSHKALLANHMFTHDGNVSRRCDVPNCNSSFKTRSGLSKHKRKAHSIDGKHGFTCDVCGIQVASKSTLQAHSRIHTGERPFVCQYCDKGFNHKGNLKEHIRCHTNEKPYLCSEPGCHKGFATSSQLRNHKLTHSGTNLFLCPECGKGFNTKIGMQVHARRHMGINDEECTTCHKKFADQWSLTKHRRIHTGERPYRCKVCRKTFSDPSNFAKHRKIHPVPSNSSGKVSSAATAVSTRSNTVDPKGSNSNEQETQCMEPESLVQILTAEELATLSKENATASEPNVIYLYQRTDGFSVAVMDHQSGEVTAGNASVIVDLNKAVTMGETGSLARFSENETAEVKRTLQE